MNGEPMRGGRGAICRDVRLDLQRARDEHGVEMVICCLDDTELEYLGVPWGEYSDAAARLGIEVVRMPMVEGFAPKSPEGLDGVLERVVRVYTMRGKSVLSHCRGGIGRAGLVASCWMLKMGLVTSRVEGAGEAFAEEKTMDVVVKVIELIRKRRRCVSSHLFPSPDSTSFPSRRELTLPPLDFVEQCQGHRDGSPSALPRTVRRIPPASGDGGQREGRRRLPHFFLPHFLFFRRRFGLGFPLPSSSPSYVVVFTALSLSSLHPSSSSYSFSLLFIPHCPPSSSFFFLPRLFSSRLGSSSTPSSLPPYIAWCGLHAWLRYRFIVVVVVFSFSVFATSSWSSSTDRLFCKRDTTLEEEGRALY